MQVNPYLGFDGCCREAFELYVKVLGAKLEMLMTHGESPEADHVAPEWRDKVLHASLSLGNFLIMGSDWPPEYQKAKQGFSVSLSVDSAAEAERVFSGLAEGGTVTMPLTQTFWAHRFGMLTDRFGTPWMINCEKDA